MKTTQSDIIVVIAGNVETSKTAPLNAFVLRRKMHERIYRKFCNHCRTYTPSERKKHSNTAAVYLTQGRVDSRHADTGN